MWCPCASIRGEGTLVGRETWARSFFLSQKEKLRQGPEKTSLDLTTPTTSEWPCYLTRANPSWTMFFPRAPASHKEGFGLVILKTWQNLIFLCLKHARRSSANSTVFLVPEMPSSSRHRTLLEWPVQDCHPIERGTAFGKGLMSSAYPPISSEYKESGWNIMPQNNISEVWSSFGHLHVPDWSSQVTGHLKESRPIFLFHICSVLGYFARNVSWLTLSPATVSQWHIT